MGFRGPINKNYHLEQQNYFLLKQTNKKKKSETLEFNMLAPNICRILPFSSIYHRTLSFEE